ncbi:hypothetical protein HK104_009229, partial [Borealophlyctis nickersoniae]
MTRPRRSLDEDRSGTRQCREWNAEAVGLWLANNGFDQYRAAFEATGITGNDLTELTEDDLEVVGVSRASGDQARLLKAVKREVVGAADDGRERDRDRDLRQQQQRRGGAGGASGSGSSRRDADAREWDRILLAAGSKPSPPSRNRNLDRDL